MSASQLIILNTSATYARSLLAAGLALFSSRWVLNALGQTDFGLFSVLGSLIVFVTFLNSSMASSVTRYFAYAIGKGDARDLNRWFYSALIVHLFLAFGLASIGWFVGEYFIFNVLNIPFERLNPCMWVFRITLISAFISMVSTPFIAMFTAKQHFVELAVWGTLYSLLTFALSWGLSFQKGDLLVFYSICMSIILLVIQIIQVSRAIIVFDECRISTDNFFDTYRIKKIFSFASLNLIDPLGALFSSQGLAVLLNLNFGPTINSAYGIANNVAGQANQLATSMIGAFSPEMTTSEGRGDRERMLSLADRVNRLGTILIMLFALPLIVEIEYVLRLWLITPPQHTALFCKLILATMIIDRLSTGYMIAVYAHGDIAGFQMVIGTLKILTLPLAWLFLEFGFAPTSAGVALIIMQSICTFGRTVWCKRLFKISLLGWFSRVIMPCALVASVGALAALIPHWILSTSITRLIIAILASFTASLVATWRFGINDRDRNFVKIFIIKLAKKN